jgi:hypothetical protein
VNRHLVEVVRSAVGDEGLLEVVVATTARVATTQTQALKAMHQQGAEVMVLAEVAVEGTEVVVVEGVREEVVRDASMSDMMPAAEGEGFDGPPRDAQSVTRLHFP